MLITKTKIQEHIKLIEERMAQVNKLPKLSARRREKAKLHSVRESLLKAIALLDAEVQESNLEKMHREAVEKLTSYHKAKREVKPDIYRKANLAALNDQYCPTNLAKSIEFINYMTLKNDDLLCGVLSSASAPA